MNNYTITEKQNIWSIREGYIVKCNTLKSAKIIASKRQLFLGTFLTIEQNNKLVAYKKSNTWIEV